MENGTDSRISAEAGEATFGSLRQFAEVRGWILGGDWIKSNVTARESRFRVQRLGGPTGALGAKLPQHTFALD